MVKLVAFCLALLLLGSGEASAQGRRVQDQGNCTRANPCVGPQGGVYFFTPRGTRSYLPRSQTPAVRQQENCTPGSPCIGRYYISPEGTRRYMRRN
jgi:hypothetical protein